MLLTVASRCIQTVFKVFFQFRVIVVFTLLLPLFLGSATVSFAQTQDTVYTNVVADTSQDLSVYRKAFERSSYTAIDTSGGGSNGTLVKESAQSQQLTSGTDPARTLAS